MGSTSAEQVLFHGVARSKLGRIPFLSKFLANRRLKKATKILDKLDARVKQANDVIETASKSVETCCPDSISMNQRVAALHDRLSKSCKVGRAAAEEADVPDVTEKIAEDHEACRREAGIDTKPGKKNKPVWVACMRKRGYNVNNWIPASRIEEIPVKT